MAKRRGSGEGSIYERKDGRWCAQVSVGYVGGKLKRKLIYGKTRVEVSETLKRVLRDQQLGLNVAPQRQTVAGFLDSWLTDVVRPKNREHTYRSYLGLAENHLKPGIGKLNLDKLTPQRLQTFLNERSKAGVTPATLKHIRDALRAALSQAQRWQLVHSNAAKLVSLPKVPQYRPQVLSPEQGQVFLNAIKEERLEALFSVLIMLGLRRGEALGLRWCDLDLETGMLFVRHSLERIKGKGLMLAEVKSEKSRRDLRIPRLVLIALLRHQERQQKEREWCGSKWKKSGHVFTTTIGTPLVPEEANQTLDRVLLVAKLPKIRIHDLRHSAATILLALGTHPKLVQEMLGHSTFTLTMNTYSHVLPSLRNEVADRMDQAFAVSEAVKPESATIQ